nr:S-layer homology domain-containing protein [Tissierella simiarum]
MVSILGEKLVETETILLENVELPFKDINTMNKDEIKLLMGLYKPGIIQGNSNAKFDPDRKLSQAEAIIILQRVKGVLDKMKVISYNTLGIVQTYNSQEELIIKENDDKVLLTITKEFPTPGYSMSVDKIVRSPGGYKVFLNVIPPKEGLIQMQVITYKTLTLEIDKDMLGNSPYNFIVEDEKLLAFKGKTAWQR